MLVNTEPLFKKRRIVALLISIFQPGFGHLYVLRPRRAAILAGTLAATAVALFAGWLGRSLPTLLLMVFVIVSVALFSVIDAVRLASQSHAVNPIFGRWYAVLASALVYQIALLAFLPQIQQLRSFYIPSGSMEPTLLVDTKLIASLADDFAPSRNDLVIYQSPEDGSALIISRVVGLPDDVVEIRDKKLFVNGAPANEPWAVYRDPRVAGSATFVSSLQQRDQLVPLTIPPGHMYVMGDNRDFAYDSRFIGPVPLELLRARPLYVYWSPDHTRIGQRLDRD